MFRDGKIQLQIFALFLGVLALSFLALSLAWRALSQEEQANRDFESKLRLLRNANDLRIQAADMYGWQTAYAFQIRRGMPDAINDDSPLRRIFLDTRKTLQLKLAALPVEQLIDQEAVDLQSAWRLLREHEGLDQKIIAGYRSGAASDVAQATERVMYAEMTLFQQISYSLANLSESVMARANEASLSASRANAGSRRLLAWLGAASLALVLLLALMVARFMAKRAVLVQQLEILARTDALTGIANRRHWDEHLGVALERAAREKACLCVALVDLDHFKQFNDAYGHQAGDALLRDLAQVFQRELQPDGVAARYGGEEFALLLYGYDRTQARALLERLRRAAPEGQTFSAGLVQCDGTEAVDELLAQADRALYRAKANGRNRVEEVVAPVAQQRELAPVA
jgi:diguanylate cyclase (GGDEF)-like protein